MDLGFTREEEAFRAEVLNFLAEEPPESFPIQTKDECFGFGSWSYEFTKRIGEKGWIGITYPKKYGGLGLNQIYQFILNEELAYHRAPWAGHFFAYTVGRALINYGTEEQRTRFLPTLGRGEIQFWQALSEPDAGSDLMNCKTRAIERGNCYVIDGQKTWGSRAHRANHAWLMARTDPNSRSKGLSLFLIDMNTPGLSLRPIVNLAGDAAFYELYLDAVKVPKENLLGEKNGAMKIVIPSLEADRFWARSARIAYCRRIFNDFLVKLKKMQRNGKLLINDDVVRNEVVDRMIDLEVARLLSYRAICLISSGKSLTYEGSVVKLVADELGKRIASTMRGITGPSCLLESDSPLRELDVDVAREYIYSIGHGIAGGTAEIQRNTIAIRGLGLPRQ
jgi:alkylation response protein AidB-like acyl-CoA dehydrogenase